ncbi:cupin domain-containing protein [Clostridium botulinum]|uniref:cupin domain-containing protein n=1 Tax=Clostridium botulinum TaxID=1491 RepID=UPI000D12AD43|nr:cupin domain-containing protein [Clostridium botulinum]AVQ47730.1 cupin [Clostridium botulinum]AVQ49205.1 cupin [Clostridium botulinum]
MDKFLNIVTPDDVETQVLSWGSFQWMNEPRVTGTSNMAVGIGHIQPGKGHTRHNHEGSDEFIYFLSGQAEQTIETEDSLIKKTMKAGDLIFIPDSAYHSTINIGDSELVFLACYQYAGPESALRAEAEIIPAKNLVK